jgi:hypothetical protein
VLSNDTFAKTDTTEHVIETCRDGVNIMHGKLKGNVIVIEGFNFFDYFLTFPKA